MTALISNRFQKANAALMAHWIRNYCCEMTNIQCNLRTVLPCLPVMAKEVIDYLVPAPGQTIVDMTFGTGGHSTKILKSTPNIKIFALDRDPLAYEHAQKLSESYPDQVIPLLGTFSELPELLKKHKVPLKSVDGFLFDFGCSSIQMDDANRGFSISKNGPLDMRMDGSRCLDQPTVADVLERIEEHQLASIIKIYGREKRAKKIARQVIEARYSFRPLKTTHELAEIIESTIGIQNKQEKLGRLVQNATKTFQALRIFVNNELNEINYGILLAKQYLKLYGRLITISFHSLEDTIVKTHINPNMSDYGNNVLPLNYSNYGKVFNQNEIHNVTKSDWTMLHKHVLIPTQQEIDENPRSRTAKFRAMMKIQ